MIYVYILFTRLKRNKTLSIVPADLYKQYQYLKNF